MHTSRRTTLALSVTFLLGACSSTTSVPSPGPTVTPLQTAARSDMPTPGTTHQPSASAEASATPQDMADMGASGETVEVEITNFAFSPADVTVSPGTEVVFTNLDSAPHTVTAGSDAAPMPEVFDSGLLEQGESFSFVFDEAGTFAYFCERHPPMEATVTVEK